MTKMIVGLGNPGEKYDKTRHNMGFMAIDLLAKELNADFHEDKTFLSTIASTFVNGEKIFLVKPLTFMNESGRAVAPLLKYYNVDPEDLTVIHDDLDSPIGRLRLRQKGSSGGQNGIKSIITHVGTQDFNRVKIGIGRPKEGMSVVNHVLGRFSKDENETGMGGVFKAVDALKFYLDNGEFSKTMNKYNG